MVVAVRAGPAVSGPRSFRIRCRYLVALRFVALGLVALRLVAAGLALAATLASALAAAAAFSACAVNVRKFFNLEITHVDYSRYKSLRLRSVVYAARNAEAERTLVLIMRFPQA